MKARLILYSVIAIASQVIIGQLTSLGQGSIGFLVFMILVEIDPHFSFLYITPNLKNRNKRK